MSEGALPLVGALLSLAGSLFFLTTAVGLLRLPDFYTRAHAPTKAATLGLLLCASGSVLLYGAHDDAVWLEKLLLMLFVILTAPVSTQLLVRGAVARRVPQTPSTQGTSTTGSIELLENSGVGNRLPPTEQS
jgi:multicomponent K+:H+ antiporter subunit G